VGFLFCQKNGQRGENLNLFWEFFYRKINLLIRDPVIHECPKHGFFVIYGKFWPFGEEKKRGEAVTLTKDFFLQYLEREKKNPYFRSFLLRCLKIYI
jgi:hypothetical protein